MFEPNLQVLVPTQWINDERGKFFESLVAKMLQKMRFKVTRNVRVTGMEIDLLVENLDTKVLAHGKKR
jgi:Holliday junction resolvase-like predicted endonuclease